MAQTLANPTRTDSDEGFPVYLPAMPKSSHTRSRFEQFISNLFRRRGELRPVSQHPDQ